MNNNPPIGMMTFAHLTRTSFEEVDRLLIFAFLVKLGDFGEKDLAGGAGDDPDEGNFHGSVDEDGEDFRLVEGGDEETAHVFVQLPEHSTETERNGVEGHGFEAEPRGGFFLSGESPVDEEEAGKENCDPSGDHSLNGKKWFAGDEIDRQNRCRDADESRPDGEGGNPEVFAGRDHDRSIGQRGQHKEWIEGEPFECGFEIGVVKGCGDEAASAE